MTPTQIDYYRRRAAEEQARALSAHPEEAKRIHIELANHYRRVVAEAERGTMAEEQRAFGYGTPHRQNRGFGMPLLRN